MSDVSGYGNTETEAMNSFSISLGEFFQYTTNKNTLASELKNMGWVVKGKNKPMLPPPMSQLLASNDNFSWIFNSHPFRKFDQTFDLPLVSC